MAYLINGNGFAPVTAQQDADLYGGILGLPLTVLNVGNKMAAYVAANTDVHILDGEAVCQGRRIHINADDYDSFEIPVGTVGVVAYYIIGYRIYTDTDTGNELAETFVRHMNNATETIPEEVLRDGAAECYVSMYRITLNGLSITNTEALFDIAMSAQELAAAQDELAAGFAMIGTPIRRSANNVSMNTNTDKIITTLTLPANGKYVVLANGGCGGVNTGTTATYFALSTAVTPSTTAAVPVQWNARQMSPVNGGGPTSIIGYYETAQDCTLQLHGYLYGTSGGSTSAAWGTLTALRMA